MGFHRPHPFSLKERIKQRIVSQLLVFYLDYRVGISVPSPTLDSTEEELGYVYTCKVNMCFLNLMVKQIAYANVQRKQKKTATFCATALPVIYMIDGHSIVSCFHKAV